MTLVPGVEPKCNESPHSPDDDMIWPMSIILRIISSRDDSTKANSKQEINMAVVIRYSISF